METIERLSPSRTDQRSPTDSLDLFDYSKAFSRNQGLIQTNEQLRLKHSVVAIAGLGGVGGVHLTTLARLGIGEFRIADFDSFEIHNFNRQAGATVSSLGRPKVDVMAEQLMDINPSARLKRFDDGIHPGNIADFLEGVDVVVDGLDFFAVDAREMLFDEAERRGIPLITAGPIGMSVAWLVFRPGSMSWRDYFAFHLAKKKSDKYLLFALGLTPKATQMSYLDRSSVNLEQQRGPSLALAVQLCAGVAAAEVVKILLGRGTVKAAPHFRQFDAYKGKLVEGKLRWGNCGWIQRLKAKVFRWLLKKSAPAPAPLPETGPRVPPPARPPQRSDRPTPAQITAIADAARWAPSGDNVQPFSFHWDGAALTVHEDAQRIRAFINPGNAAGHLALGMCLATIEVASEQWGWIPRWTIERSGSAVARIVFQPGPVRESPLATAIRARTVDRRAFRTDPFAPSFAESIREQIANSWGIEFHLANQTEAVNRLAKINGGFEPFLLSHRDLHAYLFRWLRWSDTEATQDGMPLSTLGLNPADALGLRLLARWSLARVCSTIGITRLAAARAQRIFSRSAAFGGFSVADSDPLSFIRAGALWQKLWLVLTTEGYSLQPVMGHVLMALRCRRFGGEGLKPNQRERFEREEEAIRREMGVPHGKTLACLFRIGRPIGPVLHRAPRRPISALLQIDEFGGR